MEFDSIIKKRRSVRSFTSKKPSWKVALDAIESANHNPFAGNHNNLKFIIIEEEATIKKIADISEQPWISESKLLVFVCSDDMYLENLYGEKGRIYSRQQAGAAIQTILLKIVDLGFSACWVGAYIDEIIKESLRIPQHIQIEAIIPIGYEKKETKIEKPKKRTLDNVIYWETWKNEKRDNFFKKLKRDFDIDTETL